MFRTIVTCTLIGLGFALGRSDVAAQASSKGASFTVDENLAKKGQPLFASKTCVACHSIGKGKLVGPDLAHVTDRRTVEWLTKWLVKTNEMLDTDEVAKAMLAEYANIRMPELGLKEDEAVALIHYIAKESKALPKK